MAQVNSEAAIGSWHSHQYEKVDKDKKKNFNQILYYSLKLTQLVTALNK